MGAPSKALIAHGFDRAAPNGVGSAKLAGNYAPVLGITKKAKDQGYTVNLFLDPQKGEFVEEFATSNFVGIKREGGETIYVTPDSPSILASITNRSLVQLAKSFGWKVEKRLVCWSELVDGGFEEVAAVYSVYLTTEEPQLLLPQLVKSIANY